MAPKPRVALVIPALNEAPAIGAVLRAVMVGAVRALDVAAGLAAMITSASSAR